MSVLSKATAVFFDRDGTIIESEILRGKPRAQNNLARVRFIPKSIETTFAVSRLGFKCFLVTNQPDVHDGMVTARAVESVNKMIVEKTSITDFESCYVRPESFDYSKSCMKPSPRMLEKLASKWDLCLEDSWMVGDQWKDVEAGRSAGCRTILIETSYSKIDLCTPTYTVKKIDEIVEIIRNHL